MRISADGIALIKGFEGYSSTPYRCSANVWTIGFGHTKNVTKLTEPISKEYAEELLQKDLEEFENAVNRHVTVPLTQNQFDALVSLSFNIGVGAFSKSTLLKLLNKGEYNKVPYELARWNKAGGKVLAGLTRRRAAEADLWLRSETVDKADRVQRGAVERDVPTIINKENIGFGAGIASTVGLSSVVNGDGPIHWALAAIMVIGFAVGLYLFLKRRGA